MVLPSTLKLLQKPDRSTENGITFPKLLKNPSEFPATIKIIVLLLSSIVLITFWTRTIYGTWFQQLLCHSTTLMIGTLCPISSLKQQLTNVEHTRIRCSLHCERWTAKRRDCAKTLHSFNEITYRMDGWTKQLLRLKSWVTFGNPEQWLEFRRFWWTAIIFKFSYLFQLFDFYCLLVQCLLSFETLLFLFPFFDYSEWEVKVHLQHLGKVTLPWAAEGATYPSTLQNFIPA